ncbi:MAG: YihY/virulence factor BrkB family protein [Schumannella sp.]|nr:YihY/virulence factor BrkB family protein [Schumannella sp.]
MTEEEGEHASVREATAPAPDDPRKPDQLSDIEKPSWRYVLKKTLREFSSDQATDLAAALTYYGVLAVFPALLAFVSLVGLFGDPGTTTRTLLDLFAGLVPASTLDAIRGPIRDLAGTPAAGLAFVTGLAGALWSASGFVGAFARAMNRIYQIQEGRPFWKLRPVTLAVTVLAIVAAVIAAVIVAASGPLAERLGSHLGLGQVPLTIWNIARWPLLAALAVTIVAVLYYATPNIRQPRFRWMSVGSLVALIIWAIASAGFAFYAANFASYNQTYGSIGGVIVFLLWVWISNVALLFGAELDAELERGRELQAGIEAEDTIQLPPRDTKQSDKKRKQHEDDLAQGRRLRGAPALDPRQKPAEEPEEEREKRLKNGRKARKKAVKRVSRANKLQIARAAMPKKPGEPD